MYQRARMGLGYLAQEASIFRGMTVEQNVKAVVELHHTGAAALAPARMQGEQVALVGHTGAEF